MAFIAGYVSRTSKHETFSLQEKVKLYSILNTEESSGYENVIVETKFGHLIQKYKTDYPIQPKLCKDPDGNLLVTLGFFCTSDWTSGNEKLLESCVRNSAKALEQSEGEFVAILSEGHSGKVHIVNDRFASRPFYILEDRDHVYFSSNLAFLLYLASGKRAIDILGWLQIFSLGHTCGTRTTLGDVKRLQPGTHLTLSLDGIREEQYWRLEHKPEKDLDPLSYGAKVFDAFHTAVALRAKLVGKGVVALSGGLDSRLVAAALPPDSEYSAFTFINSTETSSRETKAAAEVCQILGLEHQIQQVQQRDFSGVASQVIRLTGGLRPFHHMAIVMSYIHEIRRRKLQFLLGGGPGDVLAGSYIPSLEYLDPNRMDKCIKDYCRKRVSRSEELALLFREDVMRQYSRKIYGSLLDSFESIRGPTAAHRVTAWAMIYRQPAFTFTSLIHNHPDVTEAFSHLDYKYCDLMLRLPAEWLYEENFYAFMIYNNLPELRNVMYANTGKPLSGELMHFNSREPLSERAASFFADLARSVVHQSPLARNLVRRMRPKAAPSLYRSLLRSDEKLLAEIADCLHSHSPLKEVLDVKKCLQFLDNFKTGNSPDQTYVRETELLGSLASMCLSSRYLDS